MTSAQQRRHPLRRRPLRRRASATALLLATAALLTTAAHANATGPRTEPAAATGRHAALEGVWRMDGYGTLVTIHGTRLRTYATTAVSCLPGTAGGTRAGRPDADGRTEFDAPDAARITVTPDGRNRAELRFADNAGWRELHRTAALPENCRRRPGKDPRTVFDVFWHTYAENYPFFAAKGIDWDAVRDRYRPRITAETTDDQLFGVLRDMIEPLHDVHTSIEAGPGRSFGGLREDTTMPTDDSIARIDNATAESVGVEQRRWGQGAIAYADLPGRIGYLRLTRFTGFTDKGGYPGDVAELDRALDNVFTAARTEGPRALRGLVIDLRFNGGGSDQLGLRLASRLTDRGFLAYTKHARNDPADPRKFTAGRPVQVRPYDGPAYTGPVTVLTGRLSVSAAETFTQSLMGRTPAPTRIGENTQGAFSDTLERKLPGGWTFELPNEEFLTADGRTFDGAGIPPHLRTPVFTDEEFEQHRDSALTRARVLLAGKGG
ncbi:S41 family peptidase [Streptomyces sp. H27-D2]|uniref:S41 family peptidase n=1 Tax=Streptomyces sp. H27-D2 TaxID=3046304 RepID=UPI002DBD197F|nr:S41 family peptidase [Streptomyces sp. H27-D2]MEC4021010.1 S41 family peptidase [Streptomyces sp. H27-D2]